MKSVLQSFWLLTVAFGDLIVVILASVMPALGVVSNLIFAMQWNPQNSHSSLSLPNTKLLPLISTLFTRLPNLTRLVRRIKRKQIVDINCPISHWIYQRWTTLRGLRLPNLFKQQCKFFHAPYESSLNGESPVRRRLQFFVLIRMFRLSLNHLQMSG